TRARSRSDEDRSRGDEAAGGVRFMSVAIGVDVGTSGLKALAVRDDGAVLANATCEYPLYTPHPGYAEQDPDDFVRAAFEALERLGSTLGANARAVGSIGLTGQM